MAMTPMIPTSSPMGRSRRGRASSPETKLAVCQPPYANITGVIAAPKRRKRSVDTGASSIARVVACGATTVAPATMSMAIAASFISMSAFCVLLPLRTPRQLMSVRMRSAPTATDHSGIATPIRLMA